MGVYINMEMPQSCDDCRLNNGITCYAMPDYMEDGVVGRVDDRPDWCPLVPVSPHGRLIDAELLAKTLVETAKQYNRSSDEFFAISQCWGRVIDSPTIITEEKPIDTEFSEEEYAEAKGFTE